jgi:hypothetical protein
MTSLSMSAASVSSLPWAFDCPAIGDDQNMWL